MGNDRRSGGHRQERRGRANRPPGWGDSLFAGRSRADKEAERDASLRVMFVFGGAVVLLLVGLHALFSTVGLQLGWWSAPAFAPLFVWLLASAGLRRFLRPIELDGLRWRQRLADAGLLLVVLWAAWPLWAGPAAGVWKAAHGGFGSVAAPGAARDLDAARPRSVSTLATTSSSSDRQAHCAQPRVSEGAGCRSPAT
jgi:hypothetical protein